MHSGCGHSDASTVLGRTRHDERRPAGFTLIELLVVISILALLIALLMPALMRVRNQARAVTCQAHLRQWGVLFAAHGDSNPELPLFAPGSSESLPSTTGTAVLADYVVTFLWEQRYGVQTRKLLLCPMAARPSEGVSWNPTGYLAGTGSTFHAWWLTPPATVTEGRAVIGSYGFNRFIGVGQVAHTTPDPRCWYGPTPRQAASIPVFFDCTVWHGCIPDWSSGPPAHEETSSCPNYQIFINRHSGGVNYLFLDWSVRKVGLKELFALKWLRNWPTDNRWTKAGGVTPEDWPAWMRQFKDY